MQLPFAPYFRRGLDFLKPEELVESWARRSSKASTERVEGRNRGFDSGLLLFFGGRDLGAEHVAVHSPVLAFRIQKCA